jgi:DNA-binding NtrC family response regulator
VTRPAVLIVEDEPDMLEILEVFLAGEHRVLTAPDVRLARSVLRDHACDVVITDIRLPGESGLALVAELRESRPDLPVIVVSGCEERHPELVQCWLAKPFRRADLLEAVRDALQTSRRRQ